MAIRYNRNWNISRFAFGASLTSSAEPLSDILMRIGCNDNHIDITELERARNDAPDNGDVRVLIQVKLDTFTGQHDIWLEEAALHEFIAHFESVESARSGSVSLQSCSPEEFNLTLRSIDSLGHFEVDVSLCRYRYSGENLAPIFVSGGFEIDPTQLPTILSDFRLFHGTRP